MAAIVIFMYLLLGIGIGYFLKALANNRIERFTPTAVNDAAWDLVAKMRKLYSRGPANLGYFEIPGGLGENANNVFVLVVHYDFKDIPDLERKCDAFDVKNLRISFEENRNCNFRHLHSPKKEFLLELLSDQSKLLKHFSSIDTPSVFVLFILSHGTEGGIIHTDHYVQNGSAKEFDQFTTDDVFDAVKKSGLDDCLKLVNFGPCRGNINDANPRSLNKRNSCKITIRPEMRNLVVLYSTVETTWANTNSRGSWFVRTICRCLNDTENKSLLLFFTTVFNKMHVSSQDASSFSGKHEGQTPQIKMFPQDRSFTFSKNIITASRDGQGDTSQVSNEPPAVAATNFSLSLNHGRRAGIFYETESPECLEMKSALGNLNFDTESMELNEHTLKKYFTKVHNLASVDCILTCIFGLVSENEDAEVCVGKTKPKPITDILYEFVGPHNATCIGKPKIFLIIHQDPKVDRDCGPSSTRNVGCISATNHSGWLILVVKDKDTTKKLIDAMNSEELQNGLKSLQEHLEPLMVSKTEQVYPLLDSTLQYILEFPKTSSVSPDTENEEPGKTSAPRETAGSFQWTDWVPKWFLPKQKVLAPEENRSSD